MSEATWHEVEVDGERRFIKGKSYEEAQKYAKSLEMPDLPEIYSKGSLNMGEPGWGRTEKLRAAMSFATRPDEQAAVFLEFFPDAKLESLPDGYIIAQGDDPETGAPYHGYLNEPGVSQRDVTQGLTQTALFSGPSRLVSGLIKKGGVLPGIGKAFSLAGLESLTDATRQEILDQLTTADIPFSQESVVTTGVGAIGGEAAGNALSWMMRKVRNPFYWQKDGLTDRGRDVFENAGIDPDLIDGNPEMIRQLRTQAGLPSNAAIGATAKIKPELLANRAITGATDAPLQAGMRAQESLRRVMQGEKDAIDQAYQAAKASGESGFGQQTARSRFEGVVEGLAREGYRTDKDVLGDVIKDFEATVLKGGNLPGVKANTVDAYELWRRRVVKKWQDTADDQGATKAALNKVRHDMDRQMLDMLEGGVVSGDQQAIRLWNKAIESNAAFMERWTSNSIIERTMRNKTTPAEFAQLMINTTGKKSERQQAIEFTKQTLGPDSQAWTDFKSEFVTQLVGKGGTVDTFNPKTLGRNMKKLLVTEGPILRTVLEPTDIRILNDLSRLGSETGGGPLSAIADLIYLRWGIQGHAIAGAFRRSALRLGFQERERPLFAQLMGAGGAAWGQSGFPTPPQTDEQPSPQPQ